MKLDTLGVQAFISIADRASFQRAANELHISQTAITRRLQNLEAHLGVKLIERTTRAVALTATGSDFLPQARRLMAELSNALVEIVESGKARRGDVTIACVPTAGIQFLSKMQQDRSMFLVCVGDIYMKYFFQSVNQGAMDKVVDIYEEVMLNASENDTQADIYAGNYGFALRHRFERLGRYQQNALWILKESLLAAS